METRRFKVTASVKGMTADWHRQITMSNPREKLRMTIEASKRFSKSVKVSIGDGSKEDIETFNRLMESSVPLSYYTTPRFGFKLATFEFILQP
jgi:hypothetical protein